MQVISVELNIHNILRSPSVSPAGHFTVSSKGAWMLFISGEITEEVLLLEKWTAADAARKQSNKMNCFIGPSLLGRTGS